MPPTKQPVYNAAKQWAAQRAQRPPAPPTPPTPLSQIQNNWKRPPLATINPNALMAQPMVSQYPQPQEQGPAPMAQNKLFPRPNQYGNSQTVGGMQFNSQGQRILKQDPSGTLTSMADYSPMLRDAGIAPPQATMTPMSRLMGGGVPNTPYFQERAARNALGKGSPLGTNSAYGSPAGRRAPAFDKNHPLWGKTPEEARNMIGQMQNRPGDFYNAATWVAPDGRRYDPSSPGGTTVQSFELNNGQPPMAPIGTRAVGGMEYSGSRSYPGQMSIADKNYREGMISRTNRDDERLAATGTFQQAVEAGNAFNPDGRFFQGARLGADAQGRPYFREGERPTDFAGNAQDAESAAGRRALAMNQMQNSGIGYVDPKTGAFVGRDARRFPSDGTDNAVAGRLAAGGVTPSSLTGDQLAANRLGMIQRLADKRQSAMSRVQQLAQQDTAARRERMNPSPLNRLLQNNPQAALAFQAQQNQFNNELAVERLRNEGKIGAQNAENAGWAMKGPWALAAAAVNAGVAPDVAGRQAGLPQFANAPKPGAVPKFEAGSFGGVAKPNFDYLKETLKDVNNDEYAFSLMGEMGIPQELHIGLLEQVKPKPWWKGPRMNEQKRTEDANNGVPGWWPNFLRPTNKDRALKAGEMAPLVQ